MTDKLKHTLLLLFVCVFTAPMGLVHAGGISSGGGDETLSPFSDHAWFSGREKTIRVCTEIGSNFGLTRDETLSQLDDALQTWKAYIQKKRVNSRSPDFNGRLDFTTNFTLLPSCDGTEDLSLFFGVENKRISESKKLYREPVAMAVLEKFSRKDSWGKGFIWIAAEKSLYGGKYPNWHTKKNLNAILLHELGHTYGNPHSPGTIMSAKIMDILNLELSTTAKTSIDISRELIDCEKCETKLKSHIITQGNEETKATHRLLSRILGHAFSGVTDLEFYRVGQAPDVKLTITDRDRQSTDVLRLTLTSERALGSSYVFSSPWSGWGKTSAKMMYGYIHAANGEKVSIVIESNLVDNELAAPEACTWLKLSGFIDGQLIPLSTFRMEHSVL